MISLATDIHTMTLSFEKNQLGHMPGLAIEKYHGPEMSYAISKSGLDAAAISAANYQQYLNGPKADSDAFRLGRAFHTLLEFHGQPEEFQKRVAVVPKIDGRTTAGKEAKEKFNKDAFGKLVLSHDECEQLERMLAAVNAHPEASGFLNYEAANEETFVWKDKHTNQICKCRPDRRMLKVPRGLPPNIVLDWKTCESPSDGNIIRAIAKSCETRRYHVQAAFISDGIEAVLGIKVTHFVNVFVEKSGSHRVVCVVLSDEKIQEGREEYKRNLATIAHAEKTNVWGGFVDIEKYWRKYE